MLPSRTQTGDNVRRNSAPSRPKKKAPPRPPQPKTTSLQNSQSFQQLSSHSGVGGSSRSVTGTLNTDLIDFSAPPCPPLNIIRSADANSSLFRESNEGVYRVGASIFYVKSALEKSSSHHHSGQTSGNPFSPPRPSAQSLSGTPTKTVHHSDGADLVKPNFLSHPTIIRVNDKGSSTTNGRSFESRIQSETNKPMSNPLNVPLAWDEPPVQRSVVMPTIIKPVPAAKPTNIPPKPAVVRNLYDEPDGFEDNFTTDAQFGVPQSNDTFDFSAPLPSSPSTEPSYYPSIEETSSSRSSTYNHPTEFDNQEYADAVQAYAIVLYDYPAGAEGDLELQAGDLVYLIKEIDENWLYGSCGATEGIFPANYVNVIVPLPPEFENVPPAAENMPLEAHVKSEADYIDRASCYQNYIHFTEVQYQFVAESEKELSLEANETIAILGRINEDWLFGEKDGIRGRFPASFVSPVPLDVPDYTP